MIFGCLIELISDALWSWAFSETGEFLLSCFFSLGTRCCSLLQVKILLPQGVKVVLASFLLLVHVFFTDEYYSIVYIRHTFTTHSSAEGQLSSFSQFLAVANNIT